MIPEGDVVSGGMVSALGTRRVRILGRRQRACEVNTIMGSSDFQAESAASSAAQLASDGFNILPSFGLNLRTVYVGLCHGDRAARTAFVEPRSACMRDGPPIPGSAATRSKPA